MIYTQQTKKCSVNITTNRNRVKDYGSTVYLRDGQKFEIELFNPHTHKVLAKILLNGRYISEAGLVLNPGQRVYLERYLDRDEAFIFSTYEVENSPEAIAAIAENGNVKVEFYSVWARQITWTYFQGQQPRYRDNNYNTHEIWCNSSSSTPIVGSTTNTSYFSSTIGSFAAEPAKGSLETGRVERGEATGQSFGVSKDTFSSFVFESVSLKIAPVSTKPVEVKEIRSYCTECGTRIKKATWKFCPNCGNKI